MTVGAAQIVGLEALSRLWRSSHSEESQLRLTYTEVPVNFFRRHDAIPSLHLPLAFTMIANAIHLPSIAKQNVGSSEGLASGSILHEGAF